MMMMHTPTHSDDDAHTCTVMMMMMMMMMMMQVLKNEKKALEDERHTLHQTRAALELELADLNLVLQHADESHNVAQHDLARIDQIIAEKVNDDDDDVDAHTCTVMMMMMMLLLLLVLQHADESHNVAQHDLARIDQIIAEKVNDDDDDVDAHTCTVMMMMMHTRAQ